ncbi:MAG: 2-oxoacid:acceptor oxidoreductase subunit alpha [Paludibacteraceae bacterium]|nr:2-oxoacid:acceptor oxidoreductase subunit alpha [Paludibacteraceae bacterium]MBQ6765101.1 2-oxoacid:acceptor oxidoreductase subunit alpha [Paludibacteraceae bacterium]MBR0064274.1 2-oxoacid:acceptor oxidoreductase subunit alpha [Paludibacteraceae bacterium]
MKNIVVRFCGDSGDGMQLTGNMFAQLAAESGHEISTLPDFPAEIRAPQGTLGGVSAFQVELGQEVYTSGDKADVVVAMNAAALKVCTLGSHFNHPQAHFDEEFSMYHRHAIVLVDTDSLTEKDLEKAQFHTPNPFEELGIPESVQIVPVALTTLTKEALKESGMDNKAVLKCRNMFALGLIYWLFDEPMEKAIHLLEEKFKKKPALVAPNTKVMVDGYNYGQNLALNVQQVHIENVQGGNVQCAKGNFTSIAGNKATAWGLIAAAEKAGKRLFLGSYPITPATDILHELAARKDMNVMAIQAEDEIAGVCTAIGAAFAGDLACTSTSGPGLSLKSEAIGLAVMAELPLVVIDVQRGGPSTGLPTKTEQTDLLQALYGRNGECPAVVIAASSSANCFDYAYEACKIALENMTPVILMTDTYLANGTALWRIPKLAELPEIKPQSVPEELKGHYNPALRDERGVRYWAYPGMEGYEHRNIGLERDAERGTISTNPENHEQMVLARKHKIEQIANSIPDLKVIHGEVPSDQVPSTKETLLVGWGSTEGHLHAAANELGCDLAHFNYICPLPKNTQEVLSQYKRIIVCELNTGQFAAYLRANFPGLNIEQYNEIQGQPFAVERIVNFVKNN